MFLKCVMNVEPRIFALSLTHTHTHTHTLTHVVFCGLLGTLHRSNGFYTVQTVCAIALYLNLGLTGDFVHFRLKKNTV